MTEICPDKWLAKHGKIMIKGEFSPIAVTWATALSKYTPDQIQAGLERFLESDNPHVPDLKDFLILVRKGGDGGLNVLTRRIRAANEEYGKALPPPQSQPSRRDSLLVQFRQARDPAVRARLAVQIKEAAYDNTTR